MNLNDQVEVRLSPDEYITGKVRNITADGPFSEQWTVEVEITEGGHPLFGRRLPFKYSSLSFVGITG